MLIIISGLAVILIAGFYSDMTLTLPEVSEITEFDPPLVTTVYSDDNTKIAEFYRERRIIIPISQMPEMLVKAFVAAEDSRFFRHSGVDIIGIIRAFLKNMEAGVIIQGGSTITQQLIKPLLPSEKTYNRKLREAILAYRLDRTLTKEEILARYLNQIYLGYGAYGVEAAAQNYFGKSAVDMNLAECAMLAGLPKAPSLYSPFRYPEKAKSRQQYVLKRMKEEGYITEKQVEIASAVKLDIKPRRNWYLEKAPYFAEYIRQYVEDKFGEGALYEGGLQIHTTVNLEMQEIAEKALGAGLESLEKRQKYKIEQRPQGALLCVETKTGYVKAMVGGRDFEQSSFNRAVQSRRQPGSAFKPIIYAAAIDKGFTPMSMLNDSPVSFPGRIKGVPWRPQNYDRKFYGPIRLRKAIAKSRNIPVIRVLNRIGIHYAVDYARKLGIESKLEPRLPLALGASGISLKELVTAYSVFANLGELVHPVFITKILDRHGNEIQGIKSENVRAIDEGTAYIMTNLLESVVKEGTGRRVRVLERPVAGKTGTSSDLKDAWFVGYTPDYITGAWVGFDMERPLGRAETGSRAAIPIWLGFMEKVLSDKPVREFHIPEDKVVVSKVDPGSGKLLGEDSPRGVTECFKSGTEPARYVARRAEQPQQQESVQKDTARRRKFSPGVIVTREDFFKSSL